MRNFVHVVNATLLLGTVVGSMLVYDQLPERIPTHFGLSGIPDGFAEKTWWSWLGTLGIAAVLVVVMYGVAWLTARFSGAVNMPNQKQYEALDATNKAKVIGVLQQSMYVVTAFLLLLFAALQLGSYEVAMGHAERLPWYALTMLYSVLIVPMLGTPFLIWGLNSKVQTLYKAQVG